MKSNRLLLPPDNKKIRITLLVVSTLLLLIAIMGIVSFVIVLIVAADPVPFDEGSSAAMFFIGATLFSLVAVAQILCLWPAYLGYRAAYKNENPKSNIVVGIVWALIISPIPSCIFVSIFDNLIYFFPLARLVYVLLFLPYLWTMLIGVLVVAQPKKKDFTRKIPLRIKLKASRANFITNVHATKFRSTTTTLLFLSFSTCTVLLIGLGIFLKVINSDAMTSLTKNERTLFCVLNIIWISLSAILAVWCSYMSNENLQ